MPSSPTQRTTENKETKMNKQQYQGPDQSGSVWIDEDGMTHVDGPATGEE
jgi:hypothetical protein